MRTRLAGLGDIDGILAVEDEAFLTDKLTRRKLRRLLTAGNAALLVAEAGHEIAGYALVLFRRGTGTARLYGFGVRSGQRRRGLGSGLLRAAEDEAARRGCASIRLEVADGNEGAVLLYRRAGYTHLTRLGPYYEDGTPASRYAKNLTNPVP